MKNLPIRKFTTVVGYLTEAVAITIDGRVIGVYTPMERTPGQVIAGTIDLGPDVTEVTVDTVRKALEPEQVKVQPSGKLSKGLGTIPGQEPPTDIKQFRPTFNPAPKPGSKK